MRAGLPLLRLAPLAVVASLIGPADARTIVFGGGFLLPSPADTPPPLPPPAIVWSPPQIVGPLSRPAAPPVAQCFTANRACPLEASAQLGGDCTCPVRGRRVEEGRALIPPSHDAGSQKHAAPS